MKNTKNIYQHAGKCDDKKNLKDILESALLSTPEGFTVIGNHCVYSQTDQMLNLKLQNVVLWLQNPNAKP